MCPQIKYFTSYFNFFCFIAEIMVCKKDLIHPLSHSWRDDNRMDLMHKGVIRLTFIRQSLCDSASKDKGSYRDGFPHETVGYLYIIIHFLFVQFPKRGRFLSVFSAAEHEDIFLERSSRSLASSGRVCDKESDNIPKKNQYTNEDKLCLDLVQILRDSRSFQADV